MLDREQKAEETKARVGAGEVPTTGRDKNPSSARLAEGRQAGHVLMVFKCLVLMALVAIALYGMLDQGLFGTERWMAATAAVLGLLLAARFATAAYFKDIPRPVWALVGLLAALVAAKGLSLIWSVSPTDTAEEFLRSSMYLAAFALAAASLSSYRFVGTFVDCMNLVAGAVAGYGALQKTSPVGFPSTSMDGVRVDSTLGYSNTVAVVMGMGVALGLSRVTQLKNPLARGMYAALILLFGVVLYFTFSRGGVLSLGVGLLALLGAGERRLQMLANLILVCAPLAWLLARARDLGSLSSYTPDEAVRALDGAAFRTDLVVAVLAAFVLQAGFAVLVGRYALTPRARRLLGVAAVSAFLVGIGIIVYPAADGQLESGGPLGIPVKKIEKTEDLAGRLTSVGQNDGRRIEYWKVAWEEWKERPLTGTGAGTFAHTWQENRPPGSPSVKQVHNLYLEQGTETGVFAFLALGGFAVLLVVGVWRAAKRAAGDRRVLLSGLLAALVVYLASSGLEWHWYIPASTIFFFVLAGVAAKFASGPEREVSAQEVAVRRAEDGLVERSLLK